MNVPTYEAKVSCFYQDGERRLQITFRCPKCRKHHRHGAADGEAGPVHRSAHCRAPDAHPTGYLLKLPPPGSRVGDRHSQLTRPAAARSARGT